MTARSELQKCWPSLLFTSLTDFSLLYIMLLGFAVLFAGLVNVQAKTTQPQGQTKNGTCMSHYTLYMGSEADRRRQTLEPPSRSSNRKLSSEFPLPTHHVYSLPKA